MSNLFTMIKFEYRKIICTKIFVVALFVSIGITFIAMTGQSLFVSNSYRETLKLEREKTHAVAGYFNQSMIEQVISNDIIARQFEYKEYEFSEPTWPLEIWNENVMPYLTQSFHLRNVLSPVGEIDENALKTVDNADEIDYYALRNERVNFLYKNNKTMLSKNADLVTPFYFDYFKPYSQFLNNQLFPALFMILALVACVSPVFSNERTRNTDALILTSKYGKNLIIIAKLITILSFSAIFILITLTSAFLSTLITFGSYGGDVSIQFFNFYSIDSFNMFEAVAVVCAVIFAVSIAVTMLATLLAEKTNALASIFATIMILFFGLINIPLNGTWRILNLFIPTRMIDQRYLLSGEYPQLFNTNFSFYSLAIIFYLGITVMLIPLIYRSFKKHQVL